MILKSTCYRQYGYLTYWCSKRIDIKYSNEIKKIYIGTYSFLTIVGLDIDSNMCFIRYVIVTCIFCGDDLRLHSVYQSLLNIFSVETFAKNTFVYGFKASKNCLKSQKYF